MTETFVKVCFHRFKDKIDVGFKGLSRHKEAAEVFSGPTLEFIAYDGRSSLATSGHAKTQLTYLVFLIIQKQPLCRPVSFTRLF
ncbi:hypothetical protein Bb109J_c3627 [Bdellovibrio bacteriovorus]|nr:hypothetical protein Bb109J_c3627 [Bdellovibrio bacteriovorus]